jgi:S-layer family protein
VQPGSTFYQYVETAKLRGIIDGYADGTFRPENPVTRGQTTKMLVMARGWGLQYPQSATFPDVPPTHWAFPYVETAVRKGIAGGYADGTFRPNALITRAQLSKMLSLTMQAPRPTP